MRTMKVVPLKNDLPNGNHCLHHSAKIFGKQNLDNVEISLSSSGLHSRMCRLLVFILSGCIKPLNRNFTARHFREESIIARL